MNTGQHLKDGRHRIGKGLLSRTALKKTPFEERKDAPQTTRGYCERCRRNTLWAEVRSWAKSYHAPAISNAEIRVGWRCTVCDDRKHL